MANTIQAMTFSRQSLNGQGNTQDASVPVKPPAVFCCRASSLRNEDSVQSQIDNDLPYFKSIYNVLDVYNEGVISGSHDVENRTEHLRMIDDLTIGKWKDGWNGQKITICCRETSRFTRADIYEGGNIKARLKKARVKVHGRDGVIVDFSTLTGKILDATTSIMNHEKSVELARHVCKKRFETMDKGKTTGKPTNYGYAKRYVRNDGTVMIVKRTEKFQRQKSWESQYIKGEANEVAEMEYLFTMADTRDLSLRAMAKEMREKFGNGWNLKCVRERLRNPAYCGGDRTGVDPRGTFCRSFNGEAVETDLFREKSPFIVHGKHEAIVSRELWERVQAKYPLNKTEHKGKESHALAGLVKCAKCGKNMRADKDRHGNIRYRCRPDIEVGNLSCSSWTVKESELLAELLPRLVTVVDAKVIEAMDYKPQAIVSPEEVEGLRSKAETLRKKIEQGQEKLFDVEPENMKPFQAKLNVLRAELKEVNQKIESMANVDDEDAEREIEFAWMNLRNTFIQYGWNTGLFDLGLADAPEPMVACIEPNILRNALKRLGTSVMLSFARNEKDTAWDRVKTMVEGELSKVCLSERGVLTQPGRPATAATLADPAQRAHSQRLGAGVSCLGWACKSCSSRASAGAA